MNCINIIRPYKYLNMWVFDDEKVGLIQEPFVSGADTLIDLITANIANAEEGFILVFSNNNFPNTDTVLEWKREESHGNWYYSKMFNIEAWLCPALYKYFDTAPQKLYVQIKAIQ